MAKTIESLFYWLAFITDFSLILCFLYVFLFLKKQRSFSPVWLIPIYTIINLTINLAVEFFPFKQVLFVYTCFTFIEFALFTLFIYYQIINPFFKKLILLFSLLFSLFLPIYYAWFFHGSSIDSIPIGIETLLILFFCFYYFYEQMNDLENHYIYNRFHFWIVIGILLYLAGSFFIYIFANHVDKQTQNKFWFLTYFFYVVKNILFIIGFSNKNRPQSQFPRNLHPYLN